MKENLKPCAYKQSEHVKVCRRTFCRTVRRVYVCSKVKSLRFEAAGRPSLNRAKELHVYDPKPSDLPMDRLKLE